MRFWRNIEAILTPHREGRRWWKTLGCLMAAGLAIWLLCPYLILACAPFVVRKGEGGGQWLKDSLIFCGSGSISPTIASLRNHSPWVRNYCYLPSVLNHFGEPARKKLLVAVDAEDDMHAKARLISSLQRGFGDYSRFDLWFTNRDSASEWEVVNIGRDIHAAFPDAPPLQISFKVNPDFVDWWKANHSTK